MTGFDFQPTLVGRLVHLRPTRRTDLEALYRIAADPELWAQHPVPELCERAVFEANFEDAFGDEGALTAIQRTSGRIVGYSRYSQRHAGPDAVEIGWTFLARSLWGGRYNADMKRIMCEHALATFPTVLFRVGEDNIRSRRALEKIGAAPNGWRQDVESFGRTAPRVGYALTREAFLDSLCLGL